LLIKKEDHYERRAATLETSLSKRGETRNDFANLFQSLPFGPSCRRICLCGPCFFGPSGACHAADLAYGLPPSGGTAGAGKREDLKKTPINWIIRAEYLGALRHQKPGAWGGGGPKCSRATAYYKRSFGPVKKLYRWWGAKEGARFPHDQQCPS